MKRAVYALICFLAISIGIKAQPVILSPTNGQVFYNGDVMQITWKSPEIGSSENVWILLQMTGTDEGSWIAADVTNNGTYTWSAVNYNITHTNFTITVMDDYDSAPISIVIINGSRPPTPSKLTSISDVGPYQGYEVYQVSGTCQSGYTNYLEYSTNLFSWNRFTDTPECPTNNQIGWYVESIEPKLFFRVATVYGP